MSRVPTVQLRPATEILPKVIARVLCPLSRCSRGGKGYFSIADLGSDCGPEDEAPPLPLARRSDDHCNFDYNFVY